MQVVRNRIQLRLRRVLNFGSERMLTFSCKTLLASNFQSAALSFRPFSITLSVIEGIRWLIALAMRRISGSVIATLPNFIQLIHH